MSKLVTIICILFFLSTSLFAQDIPPTKRLSLKIPTTNLLNFIRPNLALALEYENGSRYSVQGRYAYKPSNFGVYGIYTDRLNYRYNRAEVEFRINYYIGESRLFTGFQVFSSTENFEKENDYYLDLNSNQVFYNSAAILVARNGGMANLGIEVRRSKKVSYEFIMAVGIHNTGVIHSQVERNPIFGFGFSEGLFQAHIREGQRIGAAIRFDFNIILPMKRF